MNAAGSASDSARAIHVESDTLHVTKTTSTVAQNLGTYQRIHAVGTARKMVYPWDSTTASSL